MNQYICSRIPSFKAIDELAMKAASLGANAVLGVDFETTIPGSSSIMVSVNGTAVIVEKRP